MSLHDGEKSAEGTTTAVGELQDLVKEIACEQQLDARLARDAGLEQRAVKIAKDVAARAYSSHPVTMRESDSRIDHLARDEFHRAMFLVYQQHMRLPDQGPVGNALHPLSMKIQWILESAWEIDMLRRANASLDLDVLGNLDPAGFCQWYVETAHKQPICGHALHQFLEHEAKVEQLKGFVEFESAGEAAFADLVALAQIGTSGDVKLEMGQNYWDEMGDGNAHDVHTEMFLRMIRDLGLEPPEPAGLGWQVLAGVNVMVWSCLPRRNAFRAQGVLGAVELLAPERCAKLVNGALRVGISEEAMQYYAAHAKIDVVHAEGWMEHVIKAQVERVPEAKIEIAEGLLIRTNASLEYFDFALSELRRLDKPTPLARTPRV